LSASICTADAYWEGASLSLTRCSDNYVSRDVERLVDNNE
jgi:hypothetical protein